jgi:hypothetical protein
MQKGKLNANRGQASGQAYCWGSEETNGFEA